MQYFNEGSGERHHDDRINAQMTRRHGHTLRMVPRRAGDYALRMQEVRGNARNLIVCPSYFEREHRLGILPLQKHLHSIAISRLTDVLQYKSRRTLFPSMDERDVALVSGVSIATS